MRVPSHRSRSGSGDRGPPRQQNAGSECIVSGEEVAWGVVLHE
jgi:hypothetical protein